MAKRAVSTRCHSRGGVGLRVGADHAVLHADAAARAVAERGVVRDDDQRDAAGVESFEQAHDFVAGGAVEVAGGFVGEDQRRLHDGGARDGHALALAAGQLVGAVIGAVLQPVVVQRLRNPAVALGRRDAGQHHRQGDVLRRGQPRHEVKALEHEADAGAADVRLFDAGQRGDIAAFQAVGAGGRAVEQADQVQQRRLAGARRPHHGDVLAGVDAQVEFVQRVHFAVAEQEHALDAGELDQRGRCGSHRVVAATVTAQDCFRA